MNTSYDLNSTPKPVDRSQFLESLMDFSTPMSTIFHQCSTTTHSNTTILDQLQQKFQEHQTSFHLTQTHLNLLDHHLNEITTVLEQLHDSVDEHSSLKNTTEELEIRLLQMSTKREQIRNVIDQFHQSPIVNQTPLNQTIQQISPSICKCTDSNIELINAIKLSFNQKTTVLERFRHHLQHHTTSSHSKIQQHQQTLLHLIEKLLQQQKSNEKYTRLTHLSKPQFDQHTKQLNEFNRLHEEYQVLQNETRQLKQIAKENIKRLYHCINETTE